VIQRFSLDRSSFERFIAAVVCLQSLQQAYASRPGASHSRLLPYLLETLRATDSGELPVQTSLERVLELCLRITGAEGTALWILTGSELTCQARVGVDFENDVTCHALWTRLRSEIKIPEQCIPPLATRSDLDAGQSRVISAANAALAGPSLLIAVLSDGPFPGAVAAFSKNPGFRKQDLANLRLLGGLLQYVLAKAPAPSPVLDLYVPGLGTRDALRTTLEEQQNRTPVFGECVGAVEKTSLTLRIVVRNAYSSLVQIWNLSRGRAVSGREIMWQSWTRLRESVSPRVTLDRNALRKDLPRAVTAALGSKLADVSEQSQVSVSHVMRKLRRARYALLRQMIDQHESLVSYAEEWRRWGTARSESAQSSLLRALSQLARATKHSSAESRAAALATYYRTQEYSRGLLSACTQTVALIAGRCREARITRRTIRVAGPAVGVLAVMSLFIVGVVADRNPLASLASSNHQAATPINSPALAKSAPSSAITRIGEGTRPPQMLEHSHLQVTDPATALTIAAMSPAEIRALRRAANFGDDEAQLQLGMLYELGRHVPHSCAMAAKWVREAAQSGNPAAEYNLGIRYSEGDGVQVNLSEAEHWLRKAETHKDARAAQALAILTGNDKPSMDGAQPNAVRPGSR